MLSHSHPSTIDCFFTSFHGPALYDYFSYINYTHTLRYKHHTGTLSLAFTTSTTFIIDSTLYYQSSHYTHATIFIPTTPLNLVPNPMEVSLPSSTVHRNSSTKLTGPDSSRDGAWRRARAPDISILRSSIIVTQVSFIQVGCHTPYDCISHSHTLLNLTYCLSPFSHGIPHFNKNMT